MKKPGRDLERLIAGIHSSLATTNGYSVESPKRLRDKVSGELREFDVVITFEASTHPMIIAIECRDRSRKVGQDHVEAFAKKCNDTGVDKGVIVSKVGFAKPALKKAAAEGIDCRLLSEIDSFDWMLPESMAIFEKNILHIHWEFRLLDQNSRIPENYSVLSNDGIIATQSELDQRAVREFNNLVSENPPMIGDCEAVITFPVGNAKIIDTTSGEHFELASIRATLRVRVSRRTVPIQNLRLTGVLQNVPSTEASLFKFEHDGRTSEIMFVRKPSGGLDIVMIPTDT